MNTFTPQFLFFLETMLFTTVIFMHLVRKNIAVIFLYAAQSSVITIALFYSAFRDMSYLLMALAVMTFCVKVIIAPYFFHGLMKKHRLRFSVSTYLNGPVTLVALALITAVSYSRVFRPLTILAPANESALLLAMAMVFVSIFLIINRKGALSQMAGILSLENAIVSFAYIAGLEASAGPQFGILFNVFIWIMIASVFASMIYRHYGILDVSALSHLKEE